MNITENVYTFGVRPFKCQVSAVAPATLLL